MSDEAEREEHRRRAEEAQATLACLPVSFNDFMKTELEYNIQEIKDLFDAGVELPGLLKTEVRELGSISIKAGKLIEDAEEE